MSTSKAKHSVSGLFQQVGHYIQNIVQNSQRANRRSFIMVEAKVQTGPIFWPGRDRD